MTFADSIRTVFSKYATISGRAARSEYWWFLLFTWGVNVLFAILGAEASGFSLIDILSIIFGLVVLLPAICVGGRRLHDRDKSAWWLLLAVIPVIGTIILLIWMAMKGTDGPNRFGADPLGGKGVPEPAPV
ncbi:DUF805 domain-containing protein [Pseudooceanicola algae]|uniref:Inner membrane protein YhaH n=1 Tax=Pseudooceanicola algae TaxID=1537215 RepID=A0A418SKQ2_9RHOB|nr:DUF805 domain-containing protein [Pseudooceanicola algae]QPM90725.1 Inner membrane protein YhaH [Pseudooceanicola algae]